MSFRCYDFQTYDIEPCHNYPKDYNRFHMNRINDILSRKDTPCTVLKSGRFVSLGYNRNNTEERLKEIRSSLCEIQWSGEREEFNMELFALTKAYFAEQIKTLKDARVWAKVGEAELTRIGAIEPASFHKEQTGVVKDA